jgi:putative membrane protein
VHWDYDGDPGAGWGWWLFMALAMAAFWIGVAWVLVTVIRHGGTRTPPGPPPSDPEHILHERFARGEIDADEYRARLDALRAHRRA